MYWYFLIAIFFTVQARGPCLRTMMPSQTPTSTFSPTPTFSESPEPTFLESPEPTFSESSEPIFSPTQNNYKNPIQPFSESPSQKTSVRPSSIQETNNYYTTNISPLVLYILLAFVIFISILLCILLGIALYKCFTPTLPQTIPAPPS